MAKRKQPVQEDPVIHDLSDFVEFNITKVLYDGTKRKRATLYLVKVRAAATSHRGRKATRKSAAPSARESGLYVLKIFPESVANQDDYKRELAANVVLGRSSAPPDAQSACNAMTVASGDFPASRWPRCLGTLRTRKDPTPGTWVRRDANSDHNSALLFEYIPDLELLTRELVTEELSQEYKQVLADLHALQILHRDQILYAAWPEIVFNNLFLRPNKITGKKEIMILDLDKSLVLGNSARDKMLLRNEAQEMAEALDTALSKKDMLQSLPKEVKRLLK
ncbi:hypothetical protein JX266_010318 [Neoarthrinium moseri]|nr:hypothetical protein JX266_010318 [Neoarthrinium moseri]